MSDFAVWLCDDKGTALQILTRPERLEYAIVMHDVGVCNITLPGDTDRSFLTPDRQLQIYRNGHLERSYFLRKLRDDTETNGNRRLYLTGLCSNHLLKRRIVAYASSTSQTKANGDNTDDAMRKVITDNMGSSAATARQFNTTYFSAGTDTHLASPSDMTFPYRNVLTVLQELAKDSKEIGIAAYFDCFPISSSKFELRTTINQPGMDHTFPSGNPPLLFGVEYGNLVSASLIQDWTDEATFVYAGGQGEDEARQILTSEDTVRSGRSIWGRIEVFEDARNEPSDIGVKARANKRLEEGRPKLTFRGTILNTPGCAYGVHWGFGDKVTAVYYGLSFNCIISSVKVTVDNNGNEAVEASLNYDE